MYVKCSFKYQELHPKLLYWLPDEMRRLILYGNLLALSVVCYEFKYDVSGLFQIVYGVYNEGVHHDS